MVTKHHKPTHPLLQYFIEFQTFKIKESGGKRILFPLLLAWFEAFSRKIKKKYNQATLRRTFSVF